MPIFVDKGALLSESDLKGFLDSAQQALSQPDEVVVLLHGYAAPREESARDYRQLSARIQANARAHGEKVLIVGLQWDSTVNGLAFWNAQSDYQGMVPRAREVGHLAARQLLLGLQSRFPQAHYQIFAHSMGCEVAAACLLPDMAYTDGYRSGEVFEATRPARVDLVAMVGCDLDYDVWWRTKVKLPPDNPAFRLLWMTVAPFSGERDGTLQMRKMIRGVAAGSTLPRMTEAQFDGIFGSRSLILDDQAIPHDHEILEYLDESRLERILAAARYLAHPNQPEPAELSEADRVLKLADDAQALRIWLDRPPLSTQMYALWRLERLLCGSSKHMSDGTMEEVSNLLRVTPHEVWKARESSKCETVRRGYWPAEPQMERAGAPSWAKP